MVEPVLRVGAAGHGQVVSDDDEGGAVLGALALQERHDRVAGVDIEGAGGLVGQDDAGAAGQGPGDGHPLLLTAREAHDG